VPPVIPYMTLVICVYDMRYWLRGIRRTTIA